MKYKVKRRNNISAWITCQQALLRELDCGSVRPTKVGYVGLRYEPYTQATVSSLVPDQTWRRCRLWCECLCLIIWRGYQSPIHFLVFQGYQVRLKASTNAPMWCLFSESTSRLTDKCAGSLQQQQHVSLPTATAPMITELIIVEVGLKVR